MQHLILDYLHGPRVKPWHVDGIKTGDALGVTIAIWYPRLLPRDLPHPAACFARKGRTA